MSNFEGFKRKLFYIPIKKFNLKFTYAFIRRTENWAKKRLDKHKISNVKSPNRKYH